MPEAVTYLPKKRPAAARNKLIEAGVRLFSRQQGRGLTIRELAREAEVNHALISYHFGGVSELMAEVVERCIQDLRALFLPQVESFESAVCEAEPGDLEVLLRDYVRVLFALLAGPNGQALISAFSSPDSPAMHGIYGRFAEQILMPLHRSLAVMAAKGRGIDCRSLEAAVLGQCMTAQCMAFFRGAPTVLGYLGKKGFSTRDNHDVTRVVTEALCRTAGLAVAGEGGNLVKCPVTPVLS